EARASWDGHRLPVHRPRQRAIRLSGDEPPNPLGRCGASGLGRSQRPVSILLGDSSDSVLTICAGAGLWTLTTESSVQPSPRPRDAMLRREVKRAAGSSSAEPARTSATTARPA